ncbi:MAG: cysteine peptidase family C39 domain-containing protein [Planctomycetota bacterium]
MGILYSLLFISLSQTTVAPPRNTPDLRCGAQCLYMALKALDFPVASFEEVERRLGPASELGYSIEQLRTVATLYGMKTLPVLTSLDNLKKRQRPFCCIAHLDSGHFVLIADVNNDSVHVVNPPRTSSELAIPVFLSQWDNQALLLSKENLVPEEQLQSSSSWFTWTVSILTLLAISVVAWQWKSKLRNS